MKQRFLVIYCNADNLKCARLLMEDKISDEITELDSPDILDRKCYNECTSNQIIVHRVAPGVGSLLDFADVDPQSWIIEIEQPAVGKHLPVYTFIEGVSLAPDTIFQFYNWVHSTLNTSEKPN